MHVVTVMTDSGNSSDSGDGSASGDSGDVLVCCVNGRYCVWGVLVLCEALCFGCVGVLC
jgi:hypothetical protein